ncbi:AC4 protein [Sida bright yellow mosaic virus]|uniref:AC4 protein n=1 Tax=Sida bright yellow mosaic virus TaxID=1949196 RepID=A0A1S6KEE6_9GEMI|nr:AC4 protein [Sida bright yellow mosaic virus]AQT01547.1 AC4 protein [Sida bright yellow mosaic virus]
MGSHISTCLSSSKGNSNARIRDSSIWCPLPGQYISIRTFRELNHRPTSSPTLARTGTQSSGEVSRSTEEVLEEVSRQLTTLPQKP